MGFIDEDNDGVLTFEGEFSTSKHPEGTKNPDWEEKIELRELLDNEKVAVDDAEARRFPGLLDVRIRKELARLPAGTCKVTLVGAGSMLQGERAKFEAVGLPLGGTYSWIPTVGQNVGGLEGVQQGTQPIVPANPNPAEVFGESTFRADADSGTTKVEVVYKVQKCTARATKNVRLRRA
ncbi:MAG TPA: hypothetical protein VGZ02_09500 [Candidatus Baltobacteraceae bacterium]|nr:hypothetical protein [Candidatus Baltobacteraceae bacterium]